MSVYMIICLPERGAYYPTFALAHALEAHGHRALYPGLADFKEDVERQGLTFLTLFPDAPTSDPNVGEIPTSLLKKLLYLRKKAAQNPKRFHVLEAIANGDFAALLRAHRVDIVLLDPFLSQLAAVCRNADIRVVSMATELMNYKNHAIPPNCTVSAPSGALARPLSYTLWGKHFLSIYGRRIAFFLATRLLFFPRAPRELRRKLKTLQKRAGLPSIFSEYSWRFDLPEIVLCPEAFDFPNARGAGNRRYFGVTVDRQRVDVAFDHAIPPDKKVVYVSLGTHAAMYGKKVDRFIACLIEAARTRPDCYFIVNIGKGNSPAKFGAPPQTVLLVNFAPQLQILDRSAAIITNGGLGTVKEAIMAEVPMLVVPCRWDQFGNAARVKFHGIGDYCNINKVTALQLQEQLDQILSDSTYKTQLARMKKQVERDDEFAKGLQWLMALAARDVSPSR